MTSTHDLQSHPGQGPLDDGDLDPPVSRRTMTTGVALLATALLSAAALVLPAPYAMRSPGPTEDTLGEQGGKRLIQIEGAETFEATGELRLTTVSVLGGPGYPMTAGQVVQGWLDPQRSVQPVEQIFPESTTKEEQQQVSQAEMLSSQEAATAAALTELGYDVPATLTVVAVSEGTGADGVVRPEDVITTFQGEPVGTYADLIAMLAETEPGSDVVLGVQRGGAPADLTITTGVAEGADRALLGVYIDPEYDFPVDVTIEIEDIGGPSAGTMFALGIIDRLTREDEADGEVIAGTGTIDVDGSVGAIGGIEQKMYGALRDGAEWFLAPAGNCDQVAGNVPDGLTVVRVATLREARDAVRAIGAEDTEGLPSCTS
ncbi:PDZ domain-containing protein [Antribacter gilvus]|uniref:YlbL family protein n=1 Tax=Antribacter gilvus TaxID=2304675 RepID=UPI001F0C2704|nr:PDZ domain-containing protein [Antribacter gilvus]